MSDFNNYRYSDDNASIFFARVRIRAFERVTGEFIVPGRFKQNRFCLVFHFYLSWSRTFEQNEKRMLYAVFSFVLLEYFVRIFCPWPASFISTFLDTSSPVVLGILSLSAWFKHARGASSKIGRKLREGEGMWVDSIGGGGLCLMSETKVLISSNSCRRRRRSAFKRFVSANSSTFNTFYHLKSLPAMQLCLCHSSACLTQSSESWGGSGGGVHDSLFLDHFLGPL